MKIPKHLAIIMDGNGRWAESRGQNRTFGHVKGARVAKKMIEACAKRGVEHLTLYAFSTENWLRPHQEVSFLMNLLGRHLKRERATLMKDNIRFTTLGDISRLPERVRIETEKTISETAGNTGMHLVFALSYGSRQEIATAVKKIAVLVEKKVISPTEIDIQLLDQALDTVGTPDPDLIIRTSGEHRLSNFLLWQSAYSELYFSDILWPDFSLQTLEEAFQFYSGRERRFGKTSAQLMNEISTSKEAIPRAVIAP